MMATGDNIKNLWLRHEAELPMLRVFLIKQQIAL